MYRKILVPIDGSPTSDRALVEAARLARLCDAQLCLLHVVDPITHMTGFERPEAYVRDIHPQLIKGGETMLGRARDTVLGAEPSLQVTLDLQESHGERTWETILARARAFGADLMVLGTHGRRGFDRVLMGSDAEQVVRHADMPVLLVRPRAA